MRGSLTAPKLEPRSFRSGNVHISIVFNPEASLHRDSAKGAYQAIVRFPHSSARGGERLERLKIGIPAKFLPKAEDDSFIREAAMTALAFCLPEFGGPGSGLEIQTDEVTGLPLIIPEKNR